MKTRIRIETVCLETVFWIWSDPEIFGSVKIVLDYMYNVLEDFRKTL